MHTHPGRYGYVRPHSVSRSTRAVCAICRTPIVRAPVVNDDLTVCCSKECAAAHRESDARRRLTSS